MQKDINVFIKRRALLLQSVKKAFPGKKGSIILCAGFESARYAFEQESSFYYMTGLEEPGVVLLLNLDGTTTLYVPRYSADRAQWVSPALKEGKEMAVQWGFNEIRFLGEACRGYSLTPACLENEYTNLLGDLKRKAEQGELLFAAYPSEKITDQRLMLERLLRNHSGILKTITDITSIVTSMRRKKDMLEIESLYEAVDTTIAAHEWAATLIEPGIFEFGIQASLEFIFKSSGGFPAFPSIVASGKQSTILHYTRNDQEMREGDLVIIDAGACIDHYCADLARTYPVSGTFTERQQEVYELVLATQDYLAEIASPGYWLTNKEVPEKSLHHLAIDFLKEHGYGDYFNHLIGHFIGLDVHDVGDYREPLREGDVFTLEPGIYIPKERIGIRIEDNYWMTEDGAVCLSDELPREAHEIEEMMANEFEG